MLIADAVHIWREPGGDYHVEWQASHPDTEVTIEALAEAAPARCLREPNKFRLSGLAPGSRHFFRLRDQHGNEVLAAERRLGMEGTPNFRDFGGYRTAQGRRVKWGYLYRSGHLAGLTDSDLALLASLELDLVCDFRREEEQRMEPSRLPPERAPRIASLPIVPGSNARFFEEADAQFGDAGTMYEFMLEINRDFAAAQSATYAEMFREILSQEDARVLVHCAAGKDRTGFAAAIILSALGVPRELVMADYLLSGRYYDPVREVERLKRKYRMEHMETTAVLPMLEVREAYLASALESIESQFPSVEAYLEEALGVGPAELEVLRARYLE